MYFSLTILLSIFCAVLAIVSRVEERTKQISGELSADDFEILELE